MKHNLHVQIRRVSDGKQGIKDATGILRGKIITKKKRKKKAEASYRLSSAQVVGSRQRGTKTTTGCHNQQAGNTPEEYRRSAPIKIPRSGAQVTLSPSRLVGKKIPPLLSFIRLAAAAHWSPHAGMSHSLASPSDD